MSNTQLIQTRSTVIRAAGWNTAVFCPTQGQTYQVTINSHSSPWSEGPWVALIRHDCHPRFWSVVSERRSYPNHPTELSLCFLFSWCHQIPQHGASQNPTGSKPVLMCTPPPSPLAHSLFFYCPRVSLFNQTETAPGDHQDHQQRPLRLRHLPALPEHVLGCCDGPRQGTFRGGTYFAWPTCSTTSFTFFLITFFHYCIAASPLPHLA